MFGMMETPQRLREAPDVLPRPSAGEQAEGGLQEVLQPQAQRRLALLARQEATVNSLSLQPARGLDRPSCEIAPPLESDHGSNRADPKMERSSRVVTLLTLGDPRIDPRIAAHCRCLASRTIPAPCRTWINVFWATILLIRSSPDSCTCTSGSTRLST